MKMGKAKAKWITGDKRFTVIADGETYKISAVALAIKAFRVPLEVAERTPAIVRHVFDMIRRDHEDSHGPNRSGTHSYGYYIVVSVKDDDTRVFRSLGIAVYFRDKNWEESRLVGEIPTNLVFGSSDPTCQLTRGTQESWAISEAKAELEQLGMRIELHDASVWDDDSISVSQLA